MVGICLLPPMGLNVSFWSNLCVPWHLPYSRTHKNTISSQKSVKYVITSNLFAVAFSVGVIPQNITIMGNAKLIYQKIGIWYRGIDGLCDISI